MSTVELQIERVVAGGDGMGRGADGRVVFVPGALPGERVRVRVVDDRRQFTRAELVEVRDASPLRVTPPCPHHARGCGGCPWQHVAPAAQRDLKRDIVLDALRRIAHNDDIDVAPTTELPAAGYRTTVRGLVVDGQFAFRKGYAHDPIEVDSCLVAHPLIAEVIRVGRFGSATEVEIRCGVHTGERLVLIEPNAAGVDVPDDVITVGLNQIANGDVPYYHERIAGRTWRISAPSFFQVRADGAEVLVDLVRDAVGHAGRIVDLYSGVGLFAGALAQAGRKITAVEGDQFAAADAKHNLADTGAKVVHSEVAKWEPRPAEVVVADPSRSGLGRPGVGAVTACDPERVVLVSCDPASMARDVALLCAEGYKVERITPVDLFAHTTHVETVTVLSL